MQRRIARTISAMRCCSRSTVCFALAIVLAILFAALTADVRCHGALERYDHDLARQIHQAIPDPNLWLAIGATGWGSGHLTVPLVILVAAGLAVLRRWRLLAFWGVATIGCGLLVDLLKVAVARPRPTLDAALIVEHGWSFPSGHTMGALVVWGALAHVVARLWPRRGLGRSLGGAVAVLVLLVSAGLLYVGVHYLTDILAAYAAGGAWLALCIGVDERLAELPLRPQT